MKLIDEENMKQSNNSKAKAIIIGLIIILTIICISVITLLFYFLKNPINKGIYIDGNINSELEEKFNIKNDTTYIPIREFAKLTQSSLKYASFNGDYNQKTEDPNKCYVLKEDNEVAIFTKDSDIIYKLNLQNKNSEYEKYKIDSKVFMENGQLYTSIDGIKKGFNVSIEYDKNKNMVITSIDKLIDIISKKLETIKASEYGKLTAETDLLNNAQAIFQNLLIVKADNNKYGIVKLDNLSNFILEPKYDSISYICESESFLISSNGKYGIFSKEGKHKIDLLYDEIVSIGKEYGLYVVKSNDKYGVVNENGKVIIYPENEKIGIDIDPYTYNNVKNGYILLNKLIPVKKDELWVLYDLNGKILTDEEKNKKNIGCNNTKNESNTYSLLEIPELELIVVQDIYEKYAFANIEGNDKFFPFILDNVYIKVINGEKKYYMKSNEKEYDILETFNKKTSK